MGSTLRRCAARLCLYGLLVGCDSGAPSPDAGAPDSGTASVCQAAADGTPCGDTLICASGACVVSRCGDGIVDAAREACDDGNSTSLDGCEPTCACSCAADPACSNGDPCDGEETCVLAGACGVCVAGDGLPDGAACVTSAVTAGVCSASECVAPGCGNGVVESGEQCDDGGASSGHGCEADCTFTCEEDAQCTDHQPCTGVEMCTADHQCVWGTGLLPGTPCTTHAIPRGVCRGTGLAAECIGAGCGNSVIEPDEECDDGRNGVDTDGCLDDCTRP